MLIPITLSFNPPAWPLQKPGGSWGMLWTSTNSICTSPNCSSDARVMPWLEQIKSLRCIICIYGCGQCILSVTIEKEGQHQLSFTWDKGQHAFTVLLQGCLHSPTLYQNIVPKKYGHLDILKNITLVYYTDDSMLFAPEKQEVASMLEALIIP